MDELVYIRGGRRAMKGSEDVSANVLITGGAGFIGSHLAESLLAAGCRVSVIDDLSTGSLQNLNALLPNPRFRYVNDTIFNTALLDELMAECDEVYHLAAAVGVKLIMEKPVETIKTNVMGTELVLDYTNKYKRKILIASSSEVYGKHLTGSLQEDADSILGSTKRHRWAYAVSKSVDEFLGLAYYREKKLPVIIVRLFNTVGPRQTGQYGMVIPNFVQRALLGQPIPVHGDGQQTRSFTFVGDVVEALIRLMAHPGAVGEVVNVGNGLEVSIQTLAERVKALTQSSSEVIHVSYEDAYGEGFEDMRRRVPDTSKLRELIGFAPSMDLDSILAKVIEYFKE